MEEQKIDLNSLIVVETIPKIRETLSVISDEIDREIEQALALDCTEESKSEVKKARANLTKIKTALEERRKVVKEQVLQPYQSFEQVYNELVKDKLTEADKTLKERIDDIENSQKAEKYQHIFDFATEYVNFHHLEGLVDTKTLIPNATLSASEKSLKEQTRGEIERVANEVTIIRQEDNSDEVLAEYFGNGYNYAKAKLEVLNRHQKYHEFQAHRFDDLVAENYIKYAPKDEEEITAPKEVVEEELIECTFTVNATKEQLIQIKNYLQELGVKYE